MHALMRKSPLATLVTWSAEGPEANHVPLLLDAEAGPRARLLGHVARANPLWREHPEGVDVLAIFHGPGSYISPSWYASKSEAGKVVPTWNYVSVHARGRLRVVDDPLWIRAQLDGLTAQNERGLEHPWRVEDAPADFIAGLIAAVVGIEITISTLQGKWKVSQNRPFADRVSVAAALRRGGDETMADLVLERGGNALR
jgi:transcriptional regulator